MTVGFIKLLYITEQRCAVTGEAGGVFLNQTLTVTVVTVVCYKIRQE